MISARSLTFEIEIAAPRHQVFRLLTDLEGYARWNPFVVSGRGALRPGAVVEVTAVLAGKRGTYAHRVVAWEDDALLAWEDAGAFAAAARGQRTRRLFERPDGTSLLSQEVIIHGPLAGVALARYGAAIQAGIEAESRALKREAERAQAAEPARATWSNWAGTASCRPARVFYPQSRADLVAIVGEARRARRRIRAVGAGHSWSPLVPTDDFLVFTERLDRVAMDLSIKGKPRVVVEAGATVRQTNDVLEAAGYALPSNVVLESVRVGGLVQTGSHGSGWDERTLSDMVHSLDVVTASGEVRTYCADTTPPDVMNAARLALGTFGLLHRVTLDVVPSHTVRHQNRKLPKKDVLDHIEGMVREHEALDLFWWPFTDDLWVRSVSRSDAPVTARRRHALHDRKRADFDVAASIALYDWLKRRAHHTPALCRNIFRLIPEGEDVVDLMEAIHFRRGIEGMTVNSIELAVPLAPGFEAFHRAWQAVERRLEEYHARGRHPLNVNVDARFIQGSDALLSPARGNERTAYVGLITRAGTEGWDDFSADVMRDWLAIPGARPHWAKELPTSGDLVARVRRAFGPQITEFLRIRRDEGVDPDDLFTSPFLAQYLASADTDARHDGAAEHARDA